MAWTYATVPFASGDAVGKEVYYELVAAVKERKEHSLIKYNSSTILRPSVDASFLDGVTLGVKAVTHTYYWLSLDRGTTHTTTLEQIGTNKSLYYATIDTTDTSVVSVVDSGSAHQRGVLGVSYLERLQDFANKAIIPAVYRYDTQSKDHAASASGLTVFNWGSDVVSVAYASETPSVADGQVVAYKAIEFDEDSGPYTWEGSLQVSKGLYYLAIPGITGECVVGLAFSPHRGGFDSEEGGEVAPAISYCTFYVEYPGGILTITNVPKDSETPVQIPVVFTAPAGATIVITVGPEAYDNPAYCNAADGFNPQVVNYNDHAERYASCYMVSGSPRAWGFVYTYG